MRIRTVTYETAHLEALRTFYAETFGLPVVTDDPDRFAVEVGETVVAFTRADDDADPFYHFTWDVPENRFEEAKAWLAERTELLDTPTGDTAVHFETLDFHSVYFRDPAGNLGEFAARHTLAETIDRPFDATAFLRVSEVGMPVDDVTGVVETLDADVGITPHPRLDRVSAAITPVGDDVGMFPLVREWTEWFVTDRTARAHPIVVELAGSRADRYRIPDHPYTLVWSD